jgi:molybdate transport system ATP-binding protein
MKYFSKGQQKHPSEQINLHLQKKLHTSKGTLDFQIDLEIKAGSLTAIYGPSGVGKTTLLRMLAGLEEPDGGFISVGGKTWYDFSKGVKLAPQKRNVGFVFQDYALFPNMSVWENIRYAQSTPDIKQIEDLMEIFDLHALKKRKPLTLSGGQRQRVALARALARKPSLLLLDEPLSALDKDMRQVLQDEILQTHKRWGTTTLLVSHDLSEVFKLCDRVVTLKDGSKDRDGRPCDVFSQYETSGKVQFLAEILHMHFEDVVCILTLLVGNTPVKVAIGLPQAAELKSGDQIWIISKAFNPIVQKLNT